jgi:2,4-dienoyl-CoA reductase-like NADH-dependent reductase (Old Yellow Enzyme family)
MAKQQKSTPNKPRYVGPVDTKSIRLAKSRREVDPRNMTLEEIEALIKDHPETEAWFNRDNEQGTEEVTPT